MNYKQFIFVGLLLSMATNCFSQIDLLKPTGNSTWYFSVGGADPYLSYRQSNRTNIEFSVGVDWSLFRKCEFDPRASITETFSDLENSIYGLMDDVVDSGTMMLQAWGISQIQENYPGLYDVLVKGIKDAKESYQVSLKTCRDYQNDLKEGRNPAEGWYSINRRSSWADASESGENPVEVEQDIEENSANQGVTWIGGVRHGGEDQDPIRIVADTVITGYEHLVGSLVPDLGENSMPAVTGDQMIASVFDSAEDAAEWTKSVIGEREIRTCEDCNKLTTFVGQGMRFAHRQERERVDQVLLDAMGDINPNSEDLNALSVPGMGIMITENIIRSLQNAPFAEQQILANRLASEIALARVIQKALIARDLLDTGTQEPNIAANAEAQAELEVSRTQLERQITNILFENDIRKRVLNTAMILLSQRGILRDQNSESSQLRSLDMRSHGMKAGGIND